MALSTDESTASGAAWSPKTGPAEQTGAPAWQEPPLPNTVQRTYLTGAGSVVVGVVFLVFVAILLAYFSSEMSWAPW